MERLPMRLKGTKSPGLIILILILTVLVSCMRVSPQMTHKFDRQEGGVTSLDISPCGTMLVVGSDSGELNLYDIESGDIIRRMEGHTRKVTSVVFHPTGRYIISGSRRGLKFWETVSGSETGDFKVSTQMVRALAVTPDGEYILTGNSNSFFNLWRGFDGYLVHEFKEQTQITDVEISPDNRWAISSSGQGSVKLWDLEEMCPGPSLPGHGDYVSSVAFSPDGKYAISGGYDARLNVYEMEGGTIVRVIENPRRGLFSSGAIDCVDFSPDGIHVLAAGRNKTINVWDAETGVLLKFFTGHTAQIMSAEFTCDGKYIISGDKRGAIRMWDVWMEQVPAGQGSVVEDEAPL